MASMSHAFVVEPKAHYIYAGEVDEAIKPLSPKIEATNISIGSIPWIVFALCSEPLSNAEKAAVQTALDDFEGSMYLDLERSR